MMKFFVEFKKLTDAVNTVSKAVAVKGAKPMLSNLLVTAAEGKIRLVGTDEEIMMISTIDANIEDGGHFTIPAKLIQEILGSVTAESSEPVAFELLNEESGEMELSCGRSKFNIQIQGTDEFPPVPVLGGEDTTLYETKCEGLARALKEAAVAMSSEEGNPVQKSICIDFSSGTKAMMASTDNKRLAVTSVRDFEIPETMKQMFIVPSRAIPELQKLLESNETIKFGLYKDQLLFSSEKFQLITRLVEGRFPDYNRVLPKEATRSMKVNRKALAQCLKAVNPISRNSNNLIHFDIGPNETRVWADAKEQGKAQSFVPSELNGEPISIGFNAKFVGDFINVLDDEEVVIEMTTANYPGLFRPGNLDSEFKYVVMPMMF
jgi:DNA polymerase-3 subunit beta